MLTNTILPQSTEEYVCTYYLFIGLFNLKRLEGEQALLYHDLASIVLASIWMNHIKFSLRCHYFAEASYRVSKLSSNASFNNHVIIVITFMWLGWDLPFLALNLEYKKQWKTLPHQTVNSHQTPVVNVPFDEIVQGLNWHMKWISKISQIQRPSIILPNREIIWRYTWNE